MRGQNETGQKGREKLNGPRKKPRWRMSLREVEVQGNVPGNLQHSVILSLVFSLLSHYSQTEGYSSSIFHFTLFLRS